MKSILVLCLLIISQTYANHLIDSEFEEEEGFTRSEKPCVFKYATKGSKQSPIDICYWTNECPKTDLKISCNIYDYVAAEWQFTTPTEDPTIFIIPKTGAPPITISGGNLRGNYTLYGVNFHWGRGDFGSEHSICGKFYAAEATFIYYLSTYTNYATAKKQGALLAVSLLFKLGCEDNPEISEIINGYKAYKDDDVDTLSPFAFEFLKNYFNQACGYFYYTGSLTTYDYVENIPIIVLHKTSTISRAQLKLLVENGGPLDFNEARRAQHPLYGREVYNCECSYDYGNKKPYGNNKPYENNKPYGNNKYPHVVMVNAEITETIAEEPTSDYVIYEKE